MDFALVPDSTDDGVLNAVFRRVKERSGKVLNIYRLLGWSPALAQGWLEFAGVLRRDVRASRKLRELMIVEIAHALSADYELQHHLKMAMEAGVKSDQLTQIGAWQSSTLFDDQERAVLALADELAFNPRASSDTMSRMKDIFSNAECVEFLVTGSFYCAVAKIVNSVELKLEDEHADCRST